MPQVVDPEGAHIAALRRLADFRGQRVLELGCGDGRLTREFGSEVARVLAFDPDCEAIDRARNSLPASLAERVTLRCASGRDIDLEHSQFDLVFFSWSL